MSWGYSDFEDVESGVLFDSDFDSDFESCFDSELPFLSPLLPELPERA